MGIALRWARMRRKATSWRVAGQIGLMLAGLAAASWITTAVWIASKARDIPSLTNRLTFEGGTSASADIPLGLLCDYYEHGREHTPPRDSGGVMQRRERYYRAPPDPLDLIHRKLTGSSADVQLGRELDALQRVWLAASTLGVTRILALEEAALHSSLDPLTLLEAARGLDFLAGDQLAAAFLHAALAKASRDYALTQSGDPVGLPLLHELDQTNALWRLDDYHALELRFCLARRLNPPLSVESRRAACLLADALFYQERFGEAADVIVEVEAENLRVGDLGALDKSDLYEMEFLQGYLLCCAGRFELAIPHLRHVVGGGEHAPVASRSLFEALLQTERVEEAQACCDQLIAHFNVSPSGRAVMARRLEEARQSRQWRRSVLTPSS